MGAAASIAELPDNLDQETCQAIIGKSFDENLFHSLAVNGVIPKSKFLAALQERTDVFLTHDWGKDDGVDNHARVSQINAALQARGLKTWFDEEQMQGNVKKQMIRGIDYAQCVVVFVTRRYVDKVKGDNAEDNCQLEFNYAARRKTANKMIAVVMEDRMRNTNAWGGEVAMVLGGRLYVDMAANFEDPDVFNAAVDNLYTSILPIIGTPVLSSGSGSASIPIPVQPVAVAVASSTPTSTPAAGRKTLKSIDHDDVIALLESLNLAAYCNDFMQNEVNGEVLSACDCHEDLKELGVSMTVKAKLLCTKLTEFKAQGVPIEYLHEAKLKRVEEEQQALAMEQARLEAEAAKLNAAEREHKQREAKAKKAEEKKRKAEAAKNAPKCSNGHTMVVSAALPGAYGGYGWACNYCARNERGERWFCESCQDDICFNCAPKSTSGGLDTKTCDRGHVMLFTDALPGPYAGLGWSCNECCRSGQGKRWFCAKCQNDYCGNPCLPPT